MSPDALLAHPDRRKIYEEACGEMTVYSVGVSAIDGNAVVWVTSPNPLASHPDVVNVDGEDIPVIVELQTEGAQAYKW